MIENQKWVVRWPSGKEWTFVPYDSIGMTSCIKQGLAKGKVTVNDKEVILSEDSSIGWIGWEYKNKEEE